LRLRPDRILVGEVRGAEALDLLKAWNTGHPGGVATLHANDARAGLIRLENLVAEATPAPAQRTIAEAIHLIVSIAKTAHGRRVQELVRMRGFDGTNYQTEPVEL
jgi:type IV secretion system protein VirB11